MQQAAVKAVQAAAVGEQAVWYLLRLVYTCVSRHRSTGRARPRRARETRHARCGWSPFAPTGRFPISLYPFSSPRAFNRSTADDMNTLTHEKRRNYFYTLQHAKHNTVLCPLACLGLCLAWTASFSPHWYELQ